MDEKNSMEDKAETGGQAKKVRLRERQHHT